MNNSTTLCPGCGTIIQVSLGMGQSHVCPNRDKRLDHSYDLAISDVVAWIRRVSKTNEDADPKAEYASGFWWADMIEQKFRK